MPMDPILPKACRCDAPIGEVQDDGSVTCIKCGRVLMFVPTARPRQRR
jgi:hypothetical protein